MFYNVYVSAYHIGVYVKGKLERDPQVLCRPTWLPLGYISFDSHIDYRFLFRSMKNEKKTL